MMMSVFGVDAVQECSVWGGARQTTSQGTFSSWWCRHSNQSLLDHRLSFTLNVSVFITHTLICCCLSCHVYFSPVLCVLVGLPLSLRPIMSSSDFTAGWFLQPVILFNSWGWRYCCFWSDHNLDQAVICTKQLELTSWKQNSIETWLQWLFVEWCYYKLHWISYWKQSSKDCVWNCIWTALICGLVSFIITTTRSAFCIMCSVLFKTLFKFSWCHVV